MSKIKFITDSAADIPQKYVEQYDIQVIPFPIILGDKEYLDCVDFERKEFYTMLESAEQIPTHAQLNGFQFIEAFEEAYAAGYDGAIYICINFKGSNTGNNATQAIAEFYREHPEAKGKFELEVIDSKSYTYDYGYAVVETAKKAQDGALTVAEAVASIHDWIDHSVILFAPYDLKFARKSGRIPVAAAVVGTALGIKPIMSFPEGESKVLSKPRGDKNVIPTIIKMMQEQMEPGTPYLVIHAALEDRNQEITKACTEAVGYPPAEEFLIGGVIAVNAGPNLVGVVFRGKA